MNDNSSPRLPRRRNSESPEVIIIDDMEDDSADPNYRPGTLSLPSTSKSGKLSIMSPIMKKDKNKDKKDPRVKKFLGTNRGESIYKSQRLGGRHLNVSDSDDQPKGLSGEEDDDDFDEPADFDELPPDEGDEDVEFLEEEKKDTKEDEDSEIEDNKVISN
ncbi:unnamed protein product [Allacma fusca]|uniref:Uncharacterized protein n=1 Tax=Allacma fusca TaxID=39272 RepID=A0A8J2PS85_9HEXA|nr:unnamed protein product [Allacma fusca]